MTPGVNLLTHVERTAEVEKSLQEIDENGFCIVPDVLDADELHSLRAALDRAAAEDDAAGRASRYGPNLSNQRVWALLNRGEEFVQLATHPLALELVRSRLGMDVLLGNLSANITAPGGDREIGRLHTDQGFLLEPWPYLLATNVAWFLDDFSKENGGTLIVPKSHTLGTFPPHDLEPSAPERLTGTAGVDGCSRWTSPPRDGAQPHEGSEEACRLLHVHTSVPSWPRKLDSLLEPRCPRCSPRACCHHGLRGMADIRWRERTRHVVLELLTQALTVALLANERRGAFGQEGFRTFQSIRTD